MESSSSSHSPSPHSPPQVSTRGLWAWAFYDWAGNAFATVIQTFVFAAYFTEQVAPDSVSGTALWGNTLGVAGIIIAFGGPILGSIADQQGHSKRWIAFLTLGCVGSMALLWFVRPDPASLPLAIVLVACGTITSEFAMIFYNAMLPRLAQPDQIGRWSGWAWSMGYLGGIACLGIALVFFIEPIIPLFPLDSQQGEQVRATCVFAAGWLFIFTIPLLVWTPETQGKEKSGMEAIRAGIEQLTQTFRQIRRYAHIIKFLIARMLYVDGLATLFAFGGVYAAGTFNMSQHQVLIFGITLNITAALGAGMFAGIDDKIGGKRTILIALLGLIIPGMLILFIESMTLFWILGMVLGVFVGPVQAASRALLARMAPQDLQQEMFGLYALSGKATAFIGPLLAGWVTAGTGSQRAGMGVIIALFGLGFLIMLTVPATKPSSSS